MIIGITGGTGSGKSTACRELKSFGCTVIDADEIYRELTASGSRLIKMLASEFGEAVLDGDSLDRKKLAAAAFSSAEATRRLNELTHGEIRKEIDRRIAESGDKHIVLDIPLLYESGFDKRCDEVWTVTAPLELRIERVMKRDGISREEVEARIRHQISDEERIAKADAVIDSRTTESMRADIARLFEERLSNG